MLRPKYRSEVSEGLVINVIFDKTLGNTEELAGNPHFNPDSVVLERYHTQLNRQLGNGMQFIEMTGKCLTEIVKDDELHAEDLKEADIGGDTIVRINQQGDIEVRREDRWDVIGGLLGDFADRIKRQTGLDWS